MGANHDRARRSRDFYRLLKHCGADALLMERRRWHGIRFRDDRANSGGACCATTARNSADSSEIHPGGLEPASRQDRGDQAGESTRMTRLAIRSLVRSA
jgi:hypothetical protein